jgi:hypothetical protein
MAYLGALSFQNPRRPAPHWKGGAGGGGDQGSGCTRQGEKRCKWIKYELLVLLSRRGREIKQARARNTAAARWRPVEAREVMARAKQDSRGRARAAADVQATRGEGGSRRWSDGGSIAAARGGALHRRQRRQGGQRGARGRRRKGGVRRTHV